MARSLGYLPQPGYTGGEGIGNAFAQFGKTMSDLGQLSIDEKARQEKASTDALKLDLMKKADTRGDAELQLQQDKFKSANEKEQYNRLQKAIQAKDMASAFRAAHPNATKNLTDEQLIAWGNDIDKLLPKDAKIDKLDTRVTPEGDKILTYMQDGKIVERNMGKVKTDWNESKKSSDIPQGWVSVGKGFFDDYADQGQVKQIKDGRFIAPIGFVNSKQSEQVGNSKLLLDENLK